MIHNSNFWDIRYQNKEFLSSLKLIGALLLTLCVSGCVTNGSSRGGSYEKMPLNALEARYHKNSKDKYIAIAFSNKLKESGRHEQALAVLEKAAVNYPKDRLILTAYGKGLVSVGNGEKARPILTRAFIPDRPDWSILSALGSIEDQQGNTKKAQEFYIEALKVRPNEPSVLSNLGLSYALDKRLPEAEQILRRAASHPKADERIKANHAMVLDILQKLPPSERAAQADAAGNMPQLPADIAENQNRPVKSARGNKRGSGQRPVVISEPSEMVGNVQGIGSQSVRQAQRPQRSAQSRRRVGRYNPADFY
jgi:Flp pilus assembly protein TadD, contains TPR repeats